MPSPNAFTLKTPSPLRRGAVALCLVTMISACDKAPAPAVGSGPPGDAPPAPTATSTTPSSPAGPGGAPKTLSLAMFCQATASVLKARSDAGLSPDEMQRVESNAQQYAKEAAAAQSLPPAELERQINAVVKLAKRKLAPTDQSDAGIAKAKAELLTLAAQVKSDCVGAF